MGKLAVVSDMPPPRDPARADLAREIERRDAIDRNVNALREAEEESKQTNFELRRAHTAAESAIKAAKEAAAGALVDRALGSTGETVPPLDTARRLLTDAADALEVAQAGEVRRAARLKQEDTNLCYPAASHTVFAAPLSATTWYLPTTQIQGDKPAKKVFKSYPIVYFHIDIAEVQTAEGKLYLFVAIDRTSKLASTQLVQEAARVMACVFLEALIAIVPTRFTPC